MYNNLSNNFIAKSNGLTLKTHSLIVNECANKLCDSLNLTPNIRDNYTQVVELSSKLHDIGKCTKNFQRFLNGELQKPNLKFRHNEYGWALLSKYLSDEIPYKRLILNIVYWHHGISNQLCKHTDSEILETIDEESKENMLSYLIDIVGTEHINDDVEYLDSRTTPLFYPNDELGKRELPILQLLRSIVITADRISSNLVSLDGIDDTLINPYFESKSKVNIGKSRFEGTDRFSEQMDIVNSIHGTTILKAPAGFGKTIVGLSWALKHGKKIIWVAPRNTIAESLYGSINNELENLNITTSVQLVLTNEIQKTNDDTLGMYDAQIIITNIDSFLAPSFKNDSMDNSALLFGATLVFDEFHELVSDAPLMSLFVNVMRIRHRLLKDSNTLLLSATPIKCEQLWDSLTNKTLVLPNNENHYKAIHSEKYSINVVNEKPKISANTNSLVIMNTIKSAQNEKIIGDYRLLLHSDFTDEKRESNLNELSLNYCKYSETNDNKPNVIGTHIIQASLDVSFNNLYENVLSPESTIQRIGRCNRFGNYKDVSNVTIVKALISNDNNNLIKGENAIKNILYSRNLSDAWFDFIKHYNRKELTLDELYVIYNDFSTKMSKEIGGYVRGCFDNSSKNLSNIYPIKFSLKSKKDHLTAGSNKLRSVNGEIFFIIEHKERKGEWIGPFTKEILTDIDILFREDSNVLNRMLKTMKNLRDSNDDRFQFNDIIDNKYITIDGIRRLAKKSNTPYIVYDRVYDEELGIIKK